MTYTFGFLVLVVVAFTFYVESSRYLIVNDNEKSPKTTGFPHVGNARKGPFPDKLMAYMLLNREFWLEICGFFKVC